MVLHPSCRSRGGRCCDIHSASFVHGEYALVMLMCGIYFAVMVFVPRARYRLQHLYAARARLDLALLGVVWDTLRGREPVMLAAIVCLGVQSLGVAFAGESCPAVLVERRRVLPGLATGDRGRPDSGTGNSVSSIFPSTCHCLSRC